MEKKKSWSLLIGLSIALICTNSFAQHPVQTPRPGMTVLIFESGFLSEHQIAEVIYAQSNRAHLLVFDTSPGRRQQKWTWDVTRQQGDSNFEKTVKSVARTLGNKRKNGGNHQELSFSSSHSIGTTVITEYVEYVQSTQNTQMVNEPERNVIDTFLFLKNAPAEKSKAWSSGICTSEKDAYIGTDSITALEEHRKRKFANLLDGVGLESEILPRNGQIAVSIGEIQKPAMQMASMEAIAALLGWTTNNGKNAEVELFDHNCSNSSQKIEVRALTDTYKCGPNVQKSRSTDEPLSVPTCQTKTSKIMYLPGSPIPQTNPPNNAIVQPKKPLPPSPPKPVPVIPVNPGPKKVLPSPPPVAVPTPSNNYPSADIGNISNDIQLSAQVVGRHPDLSLRVPLIVKTSIDGPANGYIVALLPGNKQPFPTAKDLTGTQDYYQFDIKDRFGKGKYRMFLVLQPTTACEPGAQVSARTKISGNALKDGEPSLLINNLYLQNCTDLVTQELYEFTK